MALSFMATATPSATAETANCVAGKASRSLRDGSRKLLALSVQTVGRRESSGNLYLKVYLCNSSEKVYTHLPRTAPDSFPCLCAGKSPVTAGDRTHFRILGEGGFGYGPTALRLS